MRIERPVAAEVRPVVDLKQLAREARKVNIEIQDGERLVEATEEKLEDRRLRLGKLLIEARKGFSKRGDGFQEWISKEIGLPWSTAKDYMRAAGYAPRAEAEPKDEDEDQADSRPNSTQRTEEDSTPAPAPHQPERSYAPAPVRQEAPAPVDAWMSRIEQLAEDLQRHTKAMFSVAQELDALCSQHEASIGSPSLLTARSMLAGVKASVAGALQLMGAPNV